MEDTNLSKKLTINTPIKYNTKINTVLDNFKKQNLMTVKSANSLKLENPKTPKFYTSLKSHKQENLGRPVVNPINSQTRNLSKFVNHYLQPHAQKFLSHVKGTPDFI